MAAETRTGEDSSSEEDGPIRTRISRRRLLRTGINAGVSAGLVLGFGADYVSSNDLGRITYAMARPDPDADSLEPRTKEVPVAWHEALQLAFEAQEKLRDLGLSSLRGSFVVPGSYDEPEAALSVEASDESIADQLKELVEDVAVDVTVVDDLPPRAESDFSLSDAYQLADLEDGHVPGGGVCKGSEKYGTLAPALFDAESGARCFATSNHVYGASGTKETAHRGESLSILHDDDTYQVGTVERGYPMGDIVQVVPVDEYRPASRIERASPSRVIGQYTKAGLADLMARDEQLTKVGALSDRTAGQIKGVDGVTCYTGEVCKFGQLKWGKEDTLANGDSGSVNFHPDPENPDEYILVGGINNAGTWWPGASFMWGTAAYYLLDEYGLHF